METRRMKSLLIDSFCSSLFGLLLQVFDTLNMGWRHLLWDATAMHPDYPFKDWLPHNHQVPDAPMNTSHSSRS